jgi:hypothetical protein
MLRGDAEEKRQMKTIYVYADNTSYCKITDEPCRLKECECWKPDCEHMVKVGDMKFEDR